MHCNCPNYFLVLDSRFMSLVARTCRSRKVTSAAYRRQAVVCGVLASRSVELKLSMGAHVFSREGRMNVAETFVRETVMLPIGTASYLM